MTLWSWVIHAVCHVMLVGRLKVIKKLISNVCIVKKSCKRIHFTKEYVE